MKIVVDEKFEIVAALGLAVNQPKPVFNFRIHFKDDHVSGGCEDIDTLENFRGHDACLVSIIDDKTKEKYDINFFVTKASNNTWQLSYSMKVSQLEVIYDMWHSTLSADMYHFASRDCPPESLSAWLSIDALDN